MRATSWLILVTLLSLLLPTRVLGWSEDSVSSTESERPVLALLHGRGQSDFSAEEVRGRFLDALASAQLEAYGQLIVPEDDIVFVWYGDVIDPSGHIALSSDGCRFLQESENLQRSFKRRVKKQLLRAATGLRLDRSILKTFTSDTYKYFSDLTTRCEADARLELSLANREIDRQRRIVILAHSMGGIVAYSALRNNSQIPNDSFRLKVSDFVTVGTQIGLEPILEALTGKYSEPPLPVPQNISRWTNFIVERDPLAFGLADSFYASTDARRPRDARLGSEDKWEHPHAIETYLSYRSVLDAIVRAWLPDNP